MKPALVAQIGFAIVASISVYAFVVMAKDAEARRACVPLCATRPAYAARNRTAPDFELKDLEGRTVRLSDYRGKTIVLNFWTTTCQPCLEELPSIAELAKIVRHRKDLVVLTVATDAERSTIETALKSVLREAPPFAVLHDPELRVVRDRYGTTLYPETWVIDPEGVIRARFDGAKDWSDAVLLDLVDSLHKSTVCEATFEGGRASAAGEQICDDVM